MLSKEENITLLCPHCKGQQFESLDVASEKLKSAEDTVRLLCTSCNVTFTKKELVDGNSMRIARAIDKAFQEELSNYKEIKTIHKAYLRRLLRHLVKISNALTEKNYESAERLLLELIQDTKADIDN